jgi:hypothetical protein
VTESLGPEELEDLRRAKRLLESEGIAVRLTHLLGQPIERGLELLPAAAAGSVYQISRTALDRALRVAVSTLSRRGEGRSADRLHRLATAASGAVGGVFGLPGLAVELPVTTVIMLRSIADIARSEGQDVRLPEAQLACVEVFALGGPHGGDDAAETGYFAVRATLAKALSDAAQHIAEKGLGREGAPVLVRLVEKIAARFGIVVEEKVALGSVPVISALSGSLINTVFMEHFQNKARGHFVVKRLEARHGRQAVRAAFESLP